MTKTAQASKKFGSNVMKGFKQLAGAATIAGAAYLAIRKMTEFIKGSFKAYADYEVAIRNLNSVVTSTGMAAGFTTDEMIKMADELQKVTTYSNTTTMEAQAMLATFTNLGRDVFPATLEAAMNVSTVMNQDMKMSIVQLGKAMNDPIANLGALGRTGIQFSKTQKETIKTMWEMGNQAGAQAIILKELNRQFGNAARAMRDTFKGQMTAYKNNMGDLKRILGGLMSEDSGLKGFVKKMNEFLEQENNMRNIVRVFQSLGLVAMTSFRLIIFGFKMMINQMRLVWQGVRDIGEAIKIVFDPRNWRPGKMKEAFEDFHWTVVDVVKDIRDDAVKLAMDTADAFKKILSPEMPKPALAGTMKEIVIEAEKVTKSVADLGDTIIWTGEALDFYLEQLEAARRGQEYLNSAIQETIDLGVDQQLVMGMTNKLADDYVHILNEQAKALKKHEDLVNNVKNGMISMADAIGQSNNAFVDMAKQGLKMVIRSLGEYLLGLAATAIFVDPIKAIAAFVGGMAAIAFSNTLQQGGTIPGGYGGGDSQPTMTEPGEMVITKENVRRNRALLTQINNGTANFVVPVYIGSKLIYKEITKAINETKEIKIRAR